MSALFNLQKAGLDGGVTREGAEWAAYRQEGYRSAFCDVRVADGSEYGPCWPASGQFGLIGCPDGVHIPGVPGNLIHEENVTHVRYLLGQEDFGDDRGAEDQSNFPTTVVDGGKIGVD